MTAAGTSSKQHTHTHTGELYIRTSTRHDKDKHSLNCTKLWNSRLDRQRDKAAVLWNVSFQNIWTRAEDAFKPCTV